MSCECRQVGGQARWQCSCARSEGGGQWRERASSGGGVERERTGRSSSTKQAALFAIYTDGILSPSWTSRASYDSSTRHKWIFWCTLAARLLSAYLCGWVALAYQSVSHLDPLQHHDGDARRAVPPARGVPTAGDGRPNPLGSAGSGRTGRDPTPPLPQAFPGPRGRHPPSLSLRLPPTLPLFRALRRIGLPGRAEKVEDTSGPTQEAVGSGRVISSNSKFLCRARSQLACPLAVLSATRPISHRPGPQVAPSPLFRGRPTLEHIGGTEPIGTVTVNLAISRGTMRPEKPGPPTPC
ncbi:hypothetical protein B0T25DRAFT_359664 [Lasiosphaeria hispida]|uniref:Uncharacterized protein n=1 Tax=Lasiosphaeria hispida TaxID=260671 RepID=A0AAJ0H7L3_9PEZI|nr:hypothetical protein B0T25DRAFT_359664 [Lasiosphaeria hispida]